MKSPRRALRLTGAPFPAGSKGRAEEVRSEEVASTAGPPSRDDTPHSDCAAERGLAPGAAGGAQEPPRAPPPAPPAPAPVLGAEAVVRLAPRSVGGLLVVPKPRAERPGKP